MTSSVTREPGIVTPVQHSSTVDQNDDPVPPGLLLSLDEAFRVLEALEDALLTMEEASVSPGLQDELATVIRLLHVRLGLDEGGWDERVRGAATGRSGAPTWCSHAGGDSSDVRKEGPAGPAVRWNPWDSVRFFGLHPSAYRLTIAGEAWVAPASGSVTVRSSKSFDGPAISKLGESFDK